MRSDAACLTAGFLRALARKTVALAMAAGVLLLAFLHIEIDHGVRSVASHGQQVALAAASGPCPSARVAHMGPAAAECSAPCAAPPPEGSATRATIAEPSSPIQAACANMRGAHIGLATPPPRIA